MTVSEQENTKEKLMGRTDMRKKLRVAAAVMAASMMFSAFSCASSSEGGGTASQQTADLVISNSYRCDELNSSVYFSEFGNIFPIGDGKYAFSGKDAETEETVFYISNSDFSGLDRIDMGIKKPENGEVSVYGSASPDGNIYAIVKYTDYGDFKLPDTSDPDFSVDDFDYEAMYKNVKYSYELIIADSTGQVVSRTPIESKAEYEVAEGEMNQGMVFADLFALNGGKILVSMRLSDSDIHYFTLGSDGKISDEITLINGYISGGFTDSDGNLVIISSEDYENFSLSKFDGETLKQISTTPLSGQTDSLYSLKLFKGTNEYDYYMLLGKALLGVKSDGTVEEAVSWVDSDLNGERVMAGIASDDGKFTVYINDFDNNMTGFYSLSKRDAAELANTIIINLGVMYATNDITKMATSFNKSSDNVRINVIDYNEYSDYEQGKSGEEQLKLDIISGKAPDMVICENTNMINSFSSKGVFADLYEYLDKDENLSKDDILPNAIEAGEVNGKLYSLIPSFTVATIAAKKKFLPNENWTIDEMIDAYNSMPEEMRFLSMENTRDKVFELLYFGTSPIDYSTNTCHFDTDDFKKLLNFCNSFDESPEEDENADIDIDEFIATYNESELAIHDDKALVKQVSFEAPFDYAHLRYANFGEDISFVGFPSSDGRGALFQTSMCFGIMDSSPNKDACWKFLSSFFTEEYYENANDFFAGFPTYKPAFEKKLDKSMSKPYHMENGKKVEEDDEAYYAGEIIKINPISKEERDRYAEYLMSAKPGMGYAGDVYSIVKEETGACFRGDKDVDETAYLLQSRLSIYLSEQS